jgi:sugar lactone lactonase YvrE/L-ascorbate metabolism protein UlaG (beta-lactamase superfamily)
MWIFPIAGLVSLIWFLIRVVPKPSRAMYPCQRVAFPLASGFVAWLLGLGVCGAAFRKAKLNFARRRYIVGLICVAVGVGAIWLAMSATGEKLLLAEPQPANRPMGVAQGIYPGRVVWVHDPDATDWEGPGDGHWWQSSHTNQERVSQMMSRVIRELTGTAGDAAAWNKLFRHFNKTHGNGDVAYKPGEKVVIKVNFVGFILFAGGVDPENYDLESKRDYMNTSPQMIIALLRQLVNTVGVRESDISIGDSLAYFANEYYNIFRREFPNVRYLDYAGKFGRIKMKQSSIPFYWSCNPTGCKPDYVPVSFAEADYLINFANLKAHTGAGVTLCAKNHYGSLIRRPTEEGYYQMHPSAFSKEAGTYRNLVDLMGHAHIGGKTVLYLIDGLYCGKHPIDMDRGPRRWKSYPFNGDWTSSLLASQDPVAIDSVGFDFLGAEYDDYPRASGVDDYLHEAALADNPPSGTFYDPDHSGNVKRLTGLGVHEHWNNPKEKKYSRNLGTGNGIELVAAAGRAEKPSVVAVGAKAEKLVGGFRLTEGPAADARGNIFFSDIPNNRIHKWSLDGKLSTFRENSGGSNGLYFDKDGNLLACEGGGRRLVSIDPKGKMTVLADKYQNKRFNSLNDLWIDPKGGIYFTDPRYGNRDNMEQDGEHVYYLSPDRKNIIRVIDDMFRPNGVIGTADGKLLYVADHGGKKTFVYTINKDATLSNKKLFAPERSDGMTIDNEGNVYLTTDVVAVYNKKGQRIETIDVPARPTNVFFGGKDKQTLFITARTSLYSVRMRVKAAEQEQTISELGFEQDIIQTSAGALKITFIGHGTLMFSFDGKIIHVDPVSREADYTNMPEADLILVTHEHGDHLDTRVIKTLQKEGTKLVLTRTCANRVAGGIVMQNGDVKTIQGLKIEAVPAYNIVHMRSGGTPFHPKGQGNGYVITFADKRVYVAGDTENTPEMKRLKNIDIAFLPMNLPYTMTPEMVADAAKAFEPKILYPYHYGRTDPQRLVNLMKGSKGIEVRIRKMR